MERRKLLANPYRPGAGHLPPFLGGRLEEQRHLKRVLHHSSITENILITGLRGYGKTVLLEHMKRMAEPHDWLWVGNDLSESATLTEERLALRILTDLAKAISDRLDRASDDARGPDARLQQRLDRVSKSDGDAVTFDALKQRFEQAPGLTSDRLKAVLLQVMVVAQKAKLSGIVLAYDEAQCLCDHAEHNEFPMSMLIEIVASLQKEGLSPCLLILSGLPHVFDALTATRTYTERMFHVMTLDRLSRSETWDALVNPLSKLMPPLHASHELLSKVVEMSGGYPYLIQFFGRELIEQILENGGTLGADQFPAESTLDRLDAGLFAARWNKTTDRQREFLALVANRPNTNSSDFSANEILKNQTEATSFDGSSANQILAALVDRGLLYRTRHGRYAFTVPMSEMMIVRRLRRELDVADSWNTHSQIAPAPPPPAAGHIPPKPARKKSWFGALRS
jgi:AAA ATPase domain